MKMLIAAIVIICIAHMVRTYRWSLFVEGYEKPSFKNMLFSLSVGYIINFFIPFKLGDLVRAFLSGRKMENGKGFALATVIIERFLDVIVVGFIFGCFLIGHVGGGNTWEFLTYCLLALAFIEFLLLSVLFKGSLKKLIKAFAGIFNPGVEGKILKFFWALIWGFKDIAKKISKWKLILSTVVMWGLYLCSYWFFSHSMGASEWENVFISLFKVDALFSSQINITSEFIYYSIYLLAPAVLLLIFSTLLPSRKKGASKENRTNLLPHVNAEDRKNFLELYFSAQDPNYIENYLSINRQILVLRDCSAGSNATTILCNSGGENFYRKYAFGKDAKKLKEQIDWLKENQELLPLPKVIGEESNEDYCYYDMPFYGNAIGLFDYAHSSTRESTWELIKSALECLEGTIYQKGKRSADEETIRLYVQEKVIKNLKAVREASCLKSLLRYDTLVINGKEYKNLKQFESFLSVEALIPVFREDEYSDIHGDLTIENIICIKNSAEKDSFYIIDPNTGNIHNSPNLDYGKMLQSVHGNYEFFMATTDVECKENRIEFQFIRSDAYEYLYQELEQYLKEHFTKTHIKSIYYHELIHWLRLMPYKISRSEESAVLFYAGMIMAMNDVFKRFEE